MELLNSNFKEWKYSQDCSLKKELITLLSKIVCWRVTLFQLEKYQLVFWMNVTEWPKYTLTSQQFWKLNKSGPKWCKIKMNVTGCLSIINHWLWQTLKEPFSFLLHFSYLQCSAVTTFFVTSLQMVRCKSKL